MWIATVALHGVVGLYWYSIGPGDYRFPMPAAALLFAAGIAAIAWWWVRARATGRALASTKAQLRHRRMALLIAYGLGCAAAALPAGIAGNDLAWHRFTGGDPLIVRAEATAIDDVVQRHKGGTTAYYSGYAELDGDRYPFDAEPVNLLNRNDPTGLDAVDLWAVFDPDDLDAGFVVVNDRSDAESVLEYPVVPLLPFGLVIAGCCWAVQRLLLRPWKFPERSLRPIDEVPALLWALFTLPCALWSVGIAVLATEAGAAGPFQPAASADIESSVPILVWMVFLPPGIACFAAFFHATAANRVYAVSYTKRGRR